VINSLIHLNHIQCNVRTYIYFDKSKEYIKSLKGHNPWYTESIQRGQGGHIYDIQRGVYKRKDIYITIFSVYICVYVCMYVCMYI
jgi:hypothetical protein